MYFIIGADNKEYGPVSKEEILTWIEERRANRQTQVRGETGDWMSLDQFPELAEALPTPARAIAKPTEDFVNEPSVQSEPVTSQRAMAAAILGGFSTTLCCMCPFVSPIAITLGSVAVSDINASPDELKGKGLAVTGIILGALGIVAFFGMNFAAQSMLQNGMLEEYMQQLPAQ